MTTVTYQIPSISCKHCVHTIQTEIGELEGVKSVQANADNKTAVISFESPVTEEKLIETLKAINYPPAN